MKYYYLIINYFQNRHKTLFTIAAHIAYHLQSNASTNKSVGNMSHLFNTSTTINNNIFTIKLKSFL